MRKIFFSAILLIAFMASATAANVKVTMNAISKTMTFKDKATGTPVEVGTPASNVYNFTAAAGTYVLTGYDTDGKTVNGTIELTVGTDDVAFQLFTLTAYATNTGWSYGADYTINYSAITREGQQLVITLGDSKTAGRKTFLVLNGCTYFCDFEPTLAHTEYTTLYKTGTVTFNPTASGAIPLIQEVTVTAPEGATVFVGRKTAHFVPFIEEVPMSVSGNTYTYALGKGGDYNFRVSKAGALTVGGIFTASEEPIIVTADEMAAKSPKWIDHNVASNGGYNVADIFLNINAQEHLKLFQGATFDLLPLRNWEVVNDISGNYFIEPDYHYTVTDLNGQASSAVVTIDADGTLHAVGEGTAIVTVTYDAINLRGMVGGEYWSAIWPENTGVFVVTVGDASTGIDLGMTINETNTTQYKLAGTAYDADFDVFYFPDTANAYHAYTFKPTNVKSVKVAYPTIGENAATYSGFGTDGVSYNSVTGEYTVHVKKGRQIVQLTNDAGKSEYQVLVGKPVHVEITALGRQQTPKFRPGDEVKVQLTGLYHPANKLAGVHNFSATTIYNRNGAELKSSGNQYTFCSTPAAQAVTFTIPTDYDITKGNDTLTAGIIKASGFGDPIGNHRNTSKKFGRGANFTAVSQQATFGALPEIIIPLEARPADKLLSFNTSVDECTITVKDYKGNALTPASGVYTVNSYDYTYLVEKKGYKSVAGTISVTDASPATINENVTLEAIAATDNGWDGITTSYEPDKDGDTYVIKSGYHLAWFAAHVNGGTYNANAKLANHIHLANKNWTPIGGATAAKAFKGKFEGQNFRIDSLYISSTATYQGLFGYVSNGEINDLTVSGKVTSTANYVGGIAAYLNVSNMAGCFNKVEVNGASNVAGLAAYTNGATTIDHCANLADVTASGNYAGGITANTMNKNVTIKNCFNVATITGGNYVAGISAHMQQAATIKSCFNYGDIVAQEGAANVGAIRGHKTNGTFEHIYATQAYVIDETATVPTAIRDVRAFAMGEVADSLKAEFGQTIGQDPYPVLGGPAVYRHEINGLVCYLNTATVPAANATATFENETGGIQLDETTHAWLSATPDKPGHNTWKSGEYTFYTYMDNGWGAAYYYGFYASNETENTSTGWMEPYRSAKGGAFEGTNFGIWTNDYYSTNSVLCDKPMPAIGCYVTNNAYAVNSMAFGDGYAQKFTDGSFFKLVAIGKLAGIVMATDTFTLAQDTKYVKDWTYFDLTKLGQVNEIMFTLYVSDYGTPAYFCMDNFGAAKPTGYLPPEMADFKDVPTGVQSIHSDDALAPQKILRDGVIYILRDGKIYTITGAEVK